MRTEQSLAKQCIALLAWLATQGVPTRIVDPGAGSGRFVLAAGQAFPKARLVAVEMDPLAALMLRANLTVRGMAERATVLVMALFWAHDLEKLGTFIDSTR